MLAEFELPEGYLGWTMVALATAFWEPQVAATPFERRLFLLPHCLKHAEGCPADYDEFGLDCRRCGACTIADFRTKAEQLGYKVLVAEGSPIVLKIIVSGYIDAIIGVACLNVLEKAIDKILLAGIPCMAVPLLSSDCRNTSVDEDWVMRNDRHPSRHARGPDQDLRAFDARGGDDVRHRTTRATRSATARRAAVGRTQRPGNCRHRSGGRHRSHCLRLSFEGGQASRPFITLAVYDALTGGLGTLAGGAEYLATLPDAIKRTAMSIETFHKASLVHDDIEDDDQFRYGDPTLHRKYGIATAINVGDYMIGMGYRLISRDAHAIGSDAAADILDRLAEAHMRLTEGQGAELLWRDALDKRLKPIDALKIYALKTAPAFEAALYSGLRLAGPVDRTNNFASSFARHLGVAFQILNDLGDWQGDDHNKLLAAGDVLGGRPTVLWALALEGLGDEDREELLRIVAERPLDVDKLSRVRELYQAAGVFEKAARLVDKYQERRKPWPTKWNRKTCDNCFTT